MTSSALLRPSRISSAFPPFFASIANFAFPSPPPFHPAQEQQTRAQKQLGRTSAPFTRAKQRLTRSTHRLGRAEARAARSEGRLDRPQEQLDRSQARLVRSRALQCPARRADTRGMPDYIPRSDAQYAAFMQHFVPALDAWWSRQGLDPGTLDELLYAAGDFDAAYAAHIAQQAAAEGARHAKDAARARLTAAVRPLVSFVQSYPATTDAARATLGITVSGRGILRAGRPTTAPIAIIQAGERLTHTLTIVDQSTPTRKARPKGVQRAELFVALTPPTQPAPPPPDSSGGDAGPYRYIASITRGQTTLSFESDKGGLQAHYLSRWVSTSGSAGPWSETASATVAA